MKVYFGSSEENFRIKHFKKSRYGIKALFFASEIELAKMYALYKKKQNNGIGYIYEAEIEDILYSINYNSNTSYSSEFKNIIYKLFKEGHRAISINNVLDTPSVNNIRVIHSNIIVVFDFSVIKSIKIHSKL